MRQLDNSHLDIRHLQMFVVVMDCGNMTEAARKLNIKQSTISHAIEKLRTIFDDNLFIRSGRGIVPTPRAEELRPEIVALLAHYQRLKRPPKFDPSQATIEYTIAANDFQRDAVIPELYKHLKSRAKEVRLTVIPSGKADSEILRNKNIELVISSLRPDNTDVISRRLFDISCLCFYDSACREAPETIDDFIDAKYILPSIVADCCSQEYLMNNDKPVSIKDKMVINTPSFNSAATCLAGTDALSFAPAELKHSCFRNFSYTQMPCDNQATIYLLWHKKHQENEKHKWVRQQVFAVANNRFDSH